jgi:phosphohistidine phosphatase SixA
VAFYRAYLTNNEWALRYGMIMGKISHSTPVFDLNHRRNIMKYLYFISMLLLFPHVLYAAELVGLLTPKLSGEALFSALQQGGYHLYFRHGISERMKETPDMTALGNCSEQRNLSPEGIIQTQTIGVHMRARGIPIGAVYSSPFCRTRDTAYNISHKTPEILPFLIFPVKITDEERAQMTEQLKQLLATVPSKGSNTLIVAHHANIQAVISLIPKEGEAFVFKPEENGNFSYIGQISPESW